MIIWLISEINNNNCLSLLIRALNSKWNPSAEFQQAGFTRFSSELEKRHNSIMQMPTCQPLKPKENGGLRICEGDGVGHRGNISGFLLCLRIILCSRHPRNKSYEAMDIEHGGQNIEGFLLVPSLPIWQGPCS